MAINFPASPNLNETFVSDGVTYTWDGTVWVSSGPAAFVQKSGDTMTGDLTVPSLNSGPLSGFRNQITNGDFRVWQRGTTYTYNGLNDYRPFLADRWKSVFDDGVARNGTTERVEVTDVPGFTYANRFFQDTTTANIGFVQTVELSVTGKAGQFAVGSTWTLSWYTNSDVIAAFVSWADGADDASGTRISWNEAASTVETFTNNWTRKSVTFTINNSPAGTNAALRVALVNGSGAALASAVDLTGVQLEYGFQPTPFEARPIQTELALCQRYYFTRPDNIAGSRYTSGNNLTIQLTFPVTMRTTPAISTTATVNWATIDTSASDKTMFGCLGTASDQLSGAYVQGLAADAEL